MTYIQQLNSYANYAAGWFNGTGEEITQDAIDTAKRFSRELAKGQYDIEPTTAGGIVITHKEHGWMEFEICANGGLMFTGNQATAEKEEV